MSLKRKHCEHGDSSSAKLKREGKREEASTMNEYRGFSLQQSADKPEIQVEDGTISAQDFFEKYISVRRPCIINALPKLASGKSPCISPEQLNEVAGDRQVQVERRFSKTEAFGQNRTSSRQLIMTVSDFLNKLENKDGDLYYLSTQDTGSDDLFQVPCRQLLASGYIPERVPWVGNLVLHSCNLWMGASLEGSSSGLHHDYHDNFYLLIRGRKRFRLYSPDCSPFMYTYGVIDRIYSNGLISYVGNETRADGVPLDVAEGNQNDDSRSVDSDESEDDGEEGVFFGKGHDYKSDSDSQIDFDESKDDFDEIIASERDETMRELSNQTTEKQSQRPNSFSKIDMEMLQVPARGDEKFPKFAACREVIIDLKEGQTLYLPASWFHEVTSMGDHHIALNYWYHPPDTMDSFKHPYSHREFWQEQAALR